MKVIDAYVFVNAKTSKTRLANVVFTTSEIHLQSKQLWFYFKKHRSMQSYMHMLYLLASHCLGLFTIPGNLNNENTEQYKTCNIRCIKFQPRITAA